MSARANPSPYHTLDQGCVVLLVIRCQGNGFRLEEKDGVRRRLTHVTVDFSSDIFLPQSSLGKSLIFNCLRNFYNILGELHTFLGYSLLNIYWKNATARDKQLYAQS